MAEQKKSYPMLPVSNWWALRDRFKQSIPGIVTDNYLATALNTKAQSARANILPPLKLIGLIDDEGKTQDLAKAWRDDDQYPQVCKQIKEGIYPDELLAAVPNPVEEREAVERWFANHTGSGINAVKKMASFYILLSEADVSKKPQPKSMGARKTSTSPKTTEKKLKLAEKKSKQSEFSQTPSQIQPQQFLPGVNINLEIHISADATPDQIDKIFESMAKHIYKK